LTVNFEMKLLKFQQFHLKAIMQQICAT